MTDINPVSPPAPEAGLPAPDPGVAPGAPRQASRRRMNPLLRVVAAVAGLALGWGAFQVAQNLWAGRHDNTPISSSSRAPAGSLTVSGHGVTLTFPAGWINVPKTPNELAQFLRVRVAKLPYLKAALKNQVDVQNLRSMAMLVYRVSASGTVTGSTNVVVASSTAPPSQLMPQLDGAIVRLGGTNQHDSLATFGSYSGVLVTYTLPRLPGKPAEYGAQAYVHGPASTPVITVTALGAADAAATLRLIAGTIKFG